MLRGRQALDQAVEQRLGLGVDPVQILEHQQQRLPLALAQQQLLDRVEGGAAPLGRIALLPRRHPRLGTSSSASSAGAPAPGPDRGRAAAAADLLAHDGVVVTAVDLEVAAQQVDHRQPGRRLAVRDRAGLEHARSRCARSERVASQTSRDLPTPASATSATTCPWPACARASARSMRRPLLVPPDERRQPARGRRLEAGPRRPGPDQLVHLDRAARTP